jgi:hypothetical protein
MADTKYIIPLSNKKENITVSEVVGNTTSCSLDLIGKNQPVYGKSQNTNFVHLLENFASKDRPKNPLVGQLWYHIIDDDMATLKVCANKTLAQVSDEEGWVAVPKVQVTDIAPPKATAQTGDMWYNIIDHNFNMYDETLGEWVVIGPENFAHKASTYIEGSQTGTTAQRVILGKEHFVTDDVEMGSLTLVTAKIMAREKYLTKEIQGSNLPRVKTWIYKFVVQAVQDQYDSSYYDIGLIGSPVYEIIAESNRTDTWYVDIGIGSLNGENNITINIQTKPDEGQNAGDIMVVTYVGLEMEKM